MCSIAHNLQFLKFLPYVLLRNFCAQFGAQTDFRSRMIEKNRNKRKCVLVAQSVARLSKEQYPTKKISKFLLLNFLVFGQLATNIKRFERAKHNN